MQQLNLQGKTKEQLAIEFIREHEPEEGYFLGDSGGKDSTVLRDLVIRSGVQYKSYYSATGIDPPELVKFIREHHPETIFKHPHVTRKRKFPNWKGTHSFFGMIQVNGFPMRFARWCCDDLKKNPTKAIPLKHRLMGIRAEESSSRAKRPQIADYQNGKQIIYKPIFNWLEWEIWDYIDHNDLPYCSLYDEGFSRLGCVICPFLCHGIKGQLKKHMDRWPKQYQAFEKAMKKLFDNYLCVVNPRSGAWNYKRETDFDEFLLNWYHGK